LFSVGGNVNWCSHYWRGFLKNKTKLNRMVTQQYHSLVYTQRNQSQHKIKMPA
jgi:hypothetical protein